MTVRSVKHKPAVLRNAHKHRASTRIFFNPTFLVEQHQPTAFTTEYFVQENCDIGEWHSLSAGTTSAPDVSAPAGVADESGMNATSSNTSVPRHPLIPPFECIWRTTWMNV